MVSYSIANGEQTEDLTHGKIVRVDIEGVSTLADFEVIEIFDDTNPYPALLGIGWATDMNGVINLKKHKMIFEKKSLHIVVLLDPTEGVRYTEPM